MIRLPIPVLFVLLATAGLNPARADEAAWQALGRGGHIALMRHAETVSGVGDPPGFRLDDCATQRNLSEAGRDQARRIGAAFRSHGVEASRILSSAWCRCLETGRLLGLGPVSVFEPINSFFNDRGAGSKQTAAVREQMAAWTGPGTLVLVTHQVNISALTDIYPASGEVVVLQPGGQIVGRLRIPAQ
jgi:phosphohistidine phosphatase SixA